MFRAECVHEKPVSALRLHLTRVSTSVQRAINGIIFCILKLRSECSLFRVLRIRIVIYLNIGSVLLFSREGWIQTPIAIFSWRMKTDTIFRVLLHDRAVGSRSFLASSLLKTSIILAGMRIRFFPLRSGSHTSFLYFRIVILKYFNWNLCLPTACYFAGTFYKKSITLTKRTIKAIKYQSTHLSYLINSFFVIA